MDMPRSYTLRELLEALRSYPDLDAEVSLEATQHEGAVLSARTDDTYQLLYLEEPTEEGTRTYLYSPEDSTDEEPEEKWWP